MKKSESEIPASNPFYVLNHKNHLRQKIMLLHTVRPATGVKMTLKCICSS